MISYIKNAKVGDEVYLKKLTQGNGYIISSRVPLYFVLLDEEKENVQVSLDVDVKKIIIISLRSIKKILRNNVIIYEADPRDIVYGI